MTSFIYMSYQIIGLKTNSGTSRNQNKVEKKSNNQLWKMIRIEIRQKKYRLIPKTNHLRFTSES